MKIEWTYNFLESVGFIGLSIVVIILVSRLLLLLYLWILWKRG